MKHLHFVQSTETLEGGGLGRAAWDLSRAMAGAGDDSLLLTTGRQTQHEPGLSVYRRFGFTRAFYAPQLGSDAGTLLASADVVHGHGFYVGPNWQIGRKARQQAKPLVYHVHGMFEPWILARSRYKKRLAHWLFENANFKFARLWRALTVVEADQIRQMGIRSPIIVCPNGIDPGVFAPVSTMRTALAGEKSRRQLLFLARLHPKKGLDLLIRSWATAPAAQRRDWKLVIAGPNELGHREEVEELCRQVGVTEEVEFIGPVSGETKLRALAAADAFILPSRSEGFSVAILEAMASRLPVIATHACNFPDLAETGGGLCTEASVSDITEALTALFSMSTAELVERGLAAQRLVERAYTWPHIAMQLRSACSFS